MVNDIKYETDEQKSEIFANNLKNIFCPAQETVFDDSFKTKVDNPVNNNDFEWHCYILSVKSIIYQAPSQAKISRQNGLTIYHIDSF